MYNIEMLYKARNEAIKLYDDYFLMVSEAKIKATKGTALKILTPNSSKNTNSSCTTKSWQ